MGNSGYFIGNIIGILLLLLLVFIIIYFPFIRPYRKVFKGKITIQNSQKQNNLSFYKLFSISVATGNFILFVVAIVLLINRTIEINRTRIEPSLTAFDLIPIFSLAIILFCCLMTLFFLLKNKNNQKILLTMGYVLRTHSISGIVISILLGTILYFKLSHIFFGILIFFIGLLNIIYLIYVEWFQKQSGIRWEKSS